MVLDGIAPEPTPEQAAATAAGAAIAAALQAVQPVPQAAPLSELRQGDYLTRFKLAADSVPTFDGKSSYNAVSFLTKCRGAFQTFDIKEGDKVHFASARIVNSAARFVTDVLPDPEAPPMPWAEFENQFRARFPVTPEETPQFALLHRTKLTGGQLARYVQDFNTQVSRAGSGDTAWNSMAQELFLSGLGSLRQQVEQSRPEAGWTSLNALQSTAVTVHQTSNQHSTRATNSGSSQGSGHKRSAPPAADRAGPSRKQSRLSRDAAWNAKFCSNCERNGHTLGECKRHARGEIGPLKPKPNQTKESKNS